VPVEKPAVKPILKSNKLLNVCYDIRGPVLEHAKRLEEEGHRIIKLNIGNLAPFGFDAPDEIIQDMILNLPTSSGYSDSKGVFAARKAIMHYAQQKGVHGVELDDIYIGNGASELIVMALQGLLNDGDEVLLPAPDYPLWTAGVSLSGGTPVHYICDESNRWMPDGQATQTPPLSSVFNPPGSSLNVTNSLPPLSAPSPATSYTRTCLRPASATNSRC